MVNHYIWWASWLKHAVLCFLVVTQQQIKVPAIVSVIIIFITTPSGIPRSIQIDKGTEWNNVIPNVEIVQMPSKFNQVSFSKTCISSNKMCLRLVCRAVEAHSKHYRYIGNSQWCIYNTQWKSDWLFNIQSRVLQADLVISVNNEKATLNRQLQTYFILGIDYLSNLFLEKIYENPVAIPSHLH